jgi:hypothetical protein
MKSISHPKIKTGSCLRLSAGHTDCKNVRHAKMTEVQQCERSTMALRPIAAQNPHLKLAFVTVGMNSAGLRLNG